ncbi:MAG: hypothetical protein D6E12_05250 [Desulfovibrio sp.]|nr:MAG: hypothetical protein D6E12_05250 [Desulfovibrio sp.]
MKYEFLTASVEIVDQGALFNTGELDPKPITSLDERLNELGGQGWDMVSLTPIGWLEMPTDTPGVLDVKNIVVSAMQLVMKRTLP